MKKTYFLFVVVLALTMVFGVASVAAQPQSYTTGFQVQNLSSTDPANVVMTFYNQDGSVAATVNDTVNASASNNYASLSTNQFSSLPTSFNGSLVISSDQEVAAIVNMLADGGAFGSATYGSFSAGSTTSLVPFVSRAFFNINTFVNVQNAGTSDATVTATYQPGGHTESATIPAGASVTFDQSTNNDLGDGYFGAATIISTNSVPIVAAVVQYDTDSLLAYNAFTGGSTLPVMPTVINNIFNTDTGISVQNGGTQATDVTITYTPAPGNPGATCTETQTINAGETGNFGVAYLTNTAACDGASGYIGSAAVTGNSNSQPLVALVNVVTIGGANAAAYSAFPPDAGSSTVQFPQIIKDLAIPGLNTIFSGFNVVNVGTDTTTVTCSFAGAGSGADVSASLAPGVALNAVQTGAGTGIADGTVTGATCTATGGTAGASPNSIVGVVNVVGGQIGADQVAIYEGVNQ